MNKKYKSEEQDDSEITAFTAEPVVSVTREECKNLALSYLKDPTDKKWKVVSIPFDMVTGQTLKPEVLEELDSEADAVNRFKVRVAQDLMKRVRDSVTSGAIQ
jgi:hypothetical protein